MLPVRLVASADFELFSTLHLVTVGVCLLFIAALCWLGLHLRRRAPRAERRLRSAWVIITTISMIWTAIYWMLPARFDTDTSFPLHICDIAGAAAPIALCFRWRLPKTLLYFWGIGFSTWAYILPVVAHGPSRSEFWVFWISHTQIVASALYLLIVLGYRPRLADTIKATLGLVLYAGLVTPVNLIFQANYGFIGPTSPWQPTPLDRIDAWYLRMGIVILGEVLLLLLLWLPWEIARRRSTRQSRTMVQTR